ncbi:polysaccharide pyruvyl transferase family protein [Anditalea andensis]|uniref:Polysaccharide pyruvyl transferase domain-containing protein n=1 Tax=Anditalea andensis TaxID=1048983 RepID=A0A074KW34_9BACT|nr:polysaccharide pyruvyl transferase family protein [Anditalea andensis]KEO71833.1 hypothetical protein EL17_21165 [Anditalea andensis]
MKIGILTYSRAYNYGALFQAYATKRFLKLEGHDVEIIDYWPIYHQESYKFFSPVALKVKSLPAKIKYLLGLSLGYSRIHKRRFGYKDFMINKLGLENNIKYILPEEINNNYDVIVYGSDQIWKKYNSRLFKGFDPVYFGAFPKGGDVKKISYAASMGVIDLIDEDKNTLKKLITNLNSISVREINLQEIVKELGFQVNLVLDPVFLLKKEQWFSLFENLPKLVTKKYVLVYDLNYSEASKKVAKEIALKLGLEIKIITGIVNPFAFGNKYIQTATPEYFLSLIWNADYIVTTSFHGASFSILFEKQFVALGMGKNAQRTITLLSLLGIQERYLEGDKLPVLDKINYTGIYEKLQALIESSSKWLKCSLHKDSLV